MKKTHKIILLIATMLVVISFVISETINLILNKKYVVDEIKYTERKQGLEGIQELITQDYIATINLNFIIIAVIIASTTLIVILMKKNN